MQGRRRSPLRTMKVHVERQWSKLKRKQIFFLNHKLELLNITNSSPSPSIMDGTWVLTKPALLQLGLHGFIGCVLYTSLKILMQTVALACLISVWAVFLCVNTPSYFASFTVFCCVTLGNPSSGVSPGLLGKWTVCSLSICVCSLPKTN